MKLKVRTLRLFAGAFLIAPIGSGRCLGQHTNAQDYAPASETAIAGSTLDCVNGKVYPIPKVSVMLYNAASNPDLLHLLKSLDENISMDTQEKADHFIDLYNQLL